MSNAVLDSPQTTIGAQDLLNVGHCSKSGFLRKQGSVERLFKFLKWRQRFVVLSRGCLYIFKDELATHQQTSYTLKIFLRCVRHSDGHMRWSFNVLPTDQRTRKTLLFACINDQERKDWMKSIKEEMIKAHKVSEEQLNCKGEDKFDYVYLEKPIPEEQLKPGPAKAVACEQNDDDLIQGEYTIIDEDMLHTIKPLTNPVTKTNLNKAKLVKATLTLDSPKAIQSIDDNSVRKQAATLPALPTSTSPDAVPGKCFEYHGNDRHDIESLLIQRPEGTYLVRKSRQDGTEVLSVNIDGVLKEFKIYIKKSKVTIDNANYFGCVEELIENYTASPLPKKATKLYLAYSVTDPRYVN